MFQLRAMTLAAALCGGMCAGTCRGDDGPGVAGQLGTRFIAVSITRSGGSDFSDLAGAEVTTRENQLSVGGPGFSLGSYQLALGADYQYTRYTYENISGRNRDLHRLQFPVRFAGPVAERWRLTGVVAPGVSTSSNVFKDPFGKLGTDDLLFAGRVEVSRAQRGGVRWLVGSAFDRAFGRPRAYPVAGAEFSPGPGLRVRATLPDAGIWYAPSMRHALALRLFPAGHEWHVWSEELDDDFHYRVKAFRVQGWWSLRMRHALFLDLSLAFETARRHRFSNDLGVRRSSDVDDQWLFGVGLRLGNGPLPGTHGGHFQPGSSGPHLPNE